MEPGKSWRRRLFTVVAAWAHRIELSFEEEGRQSREKLSGNTQSPDTGDEPVAAILVVCTLESGHKNVFLRKEWVVAIHDCVSFFCCEWTELAD